MVVSHKFTDLQAGVQVLMAPLSLCFVGCDECVLKSDNYVTDYIECYSAQSCVNCYIIRLSALSKG